jgi:hypothetical protein
MDDHPSRKPGQRWANRAGTARYLGISVQTLDRRVADGSIRRYALGDGPMFDLDEIDQAIRGGDRPDR